MASFPEELFDSKQSTFCGHCYETFLTKDAYEDHLLDIEAHCRLTCRYCGNPQGTNSEFLDHLNRSEICAQIKEKSIEPPYKCDYCGKGYAELLPTLDCEERCSEETKKASVVPSFKTQRAEVAERFFKCSHCDVYFVTPTSYSAHLLDLDAESRLVCRYCNKHFSKKRLLTEHLDSECKLRTAEECRKLRLAGLPKPYSCSYCHTGFVSKLLRSNCVKACREKHTSIPGLKVTREVQTLESTLRLTDQQYDLLKLAEKAVNNRCPLCEKVMKSFRLLARHIGGIVCLSRRTKNLTCKSCSQVFETRQDRDQHRLCCQVKGRKRGSHRS